MTCEHISRAKQKMNDFIKRINDSDPSVCEKINYMPDNELKNLLDELSNIKDSAERRRVFHLSFVKYGVLGAKVINIDGLNNYLGGVFNELKDCDCYNEAVRRTANRLEGVYAKNSVSKDEYNRLFERHEKDVEDYNNLARNSVNKEAYEELKKQWKKDVDDYNKLAGDHKELAEKCRNLIRRLEEYEEYKERFEEVRDRRERERIDSTREITALQRDKSNLQRQLTDTQQRLTASENKVLRIEDRLEAKGREILELRRKLERMSVNVDNLEKSREELLSEKVNLKNEKLEIFANNSGINLDEVNNLLRYYERLIHARKNYNQVNIETHEGNINQVKGAIRQGGVSVENTQKCCRKCEKVAKLRIELNEIRQQQFEARQEIPTNH